MDFSIVIVTIIPLAYTWLYVSSYSVYFNAIISLIFALLLLYFMVANTFLLPIEQLLFLFYRGELMFLFY